MLSITVIVGEHTTSAIDDGLTAAAPTEAQKNTTVFRTITRLAPVLYLLKANKDKNTYKKILNAIASIEARLGIVILISWAGVSASPAHGNFPSPASLCHNGLYCLRH